MTPKSGRVLLSCAGEPVPVSIAPFAIPYLHDFEEVARALEMYEGFVLLPVEVPSIDVANALFRWLERRGSHVRRLAPVTGGESWRALAPALLSLPAEERGPVVVVGPRETGGDLSDGLNLLNLRRDMVRGHLRRPLLWVGLRFFLDETWESAPDFWSIRDIMIRIPLRSTPDTSYVSDDGPWVEPTPPPEAILDRLEVARRTHDEPNAARALLQLARSLLARGRGAEAARAHAEGAEILARLPSFRRTVEEALGEETAGDVAWVTSTVPSREEAYRRALDAYDAIGDAHGKIRVMGKLGLSARRRNDMPAAADWNEKALADNARLGDDSLQAPLLVARSRLNGRADSPDAALADLEEALRLYQRIGDRTGEARAKLERSYLRHSLHDFAASLADCEDALRIFTTFEDKHSRARALAWRGHLRRHMEVLHATEDLDEALTIFESMRDDAWRGWALKERADVRLDLENIAGAAADYESAMVIATRDKLRRTRADVLLGQARLRAQKGDIAGALTDLDEAAAIWRTNHDRFREARVLLNRADVHQREMDLAAVALERSMAMAVTDWKTAIGFPLDGWRKIRLARQAALADYDAALVILRGVASPAQEAEVFLARARLREKDEPAAAKADASKALALYLVEKSQVKQARALFVRATAHLASSDLPAADADLSAAACLYRATESQHGQANVLNSFGDLDLLRGRLDAALESYREALRGFEATGCAAHQSICLANIARVEMLAGHFGKSRTTASRALALAVQSGHNQARHVATMVLGLSSDSPRAGRIVLKLLSSSRLHPVITQFRRFVPRFLDSLEKLTLPWRPGTPPIPDERNLASREPLPEEPTTPARSTPERSPDT